MKQPQPSGDNLAYDALREILERAHLLRMTGEVHVKLVLNEGGLRTVRIVTDEIYRPKSS